MYLLVIDGITKKIIIAVDTGTTDSVASFWRENNIPVVSCRKDSLENAIG